MTTVLAMLTVQSLLGAFDNLWHHEITEALPSKPSARKELALHTAREFLYALIFTSIAWTRWEGAWAWVFCGVLATEIAITLWDFVVEDETRRLPRFERVLHTVLAINFGAILAVWAPELGTWAAAPTGFPAADYGVWSWIMTAFGAGVLAWAVRDLVAVRRLSTPEWRRRPIALGAGADPRPDMRTVLVTGGTGFIGSAVVRALLARGDRVMLLARDPAKAAWRFGPHVTAHRDIAGIDPATRIDAFVNLAGEPLVGLPWTRARKARIVASRVETTRTVVALAARLHRAPEVLVSGSAIGFYGDRGDAVLTEASGPQPIFISDLCRGWEEAARAGEAEGMRVCLLRMGFVLGREGGSLPPLAMAARFWLGAVMGTGRQWVSWIALPDLVRLILTLVDRPDLDGPVNAVAPEPATQADFARATAHVYGRCAALRVPAAMLKALGGMSALFLASQRVLPERALAAGFAFEHPRLAPALATILQPSAQRSFPCPASGARERNRGRA